MQLTRLASFALAGLAACGEEPIDAPNTAPNGVGSAANVPSRSCQQASSFELQRGEVIPMAGGGAKLVAGDLDRDGRIDLVATSRNSELRVLAGAGDGTFRERDLLELAGTPTAIAAADLDTDGAIDLVVTLALPAPPDLPPARQAAVLLGRGDGTLDAASVHDLSGPTPDAAFTLGDFDGDGSVDLVFGNAEGIGLQRGAGDGTFIASIESQSIAEWGEIASADLDANGRPDLVVGQNVLLRTANGLGFAPLARLTDRQYNGAHPVFADLDADGDVDIVLPNGSLQVHLNDGSGRFTEVPGHDPEEFLQHLFYTSEAATGDLDCDGLPDLATAGNARPGILMGTGDGWFRAGPFVAEAFSSVALGDFDGDGLLDLAAAYPEPPAIHILLNRSR